MRDQHDQLVDQLARDILAAGLTRAQVESILYQLSPRMRRLFLRLCVGPARTAELRMIHNLVPGEASRNLNAALERAGDARRVVCERVERSPECRWFLSKPRKARDAVRA